jgi:flagellin
LAASLTGLPSASDLGLATGAGVRATASPATIAANATSVSFTIEAGSDSDGWATLATVDLELDPDSAPAAGSTASLKLGSGASLQLQIGDSGDSYNQMKVNVGDIQDKALGIDTIDISTVDGANEAMDLIKTAINTVSDIRGGLGAIQNRLEHTINNLSVMQDNMQDAESTIRDTDVASEMMKYTKNSILVQSAQAMLAQANQQPQGVLQLLQ